MAAMAAMATASCKEHGLQIVTLAAKAQVDLGVQARAARLALRCFRAEPRLVPRALLALSASGPGGRASPRKTGGLLGTIMEYTGDSLSKMVHGGLYKIQNPDINFDGV
jgi:hypothetical protein